MLELHVLEARQVFRRRQDSCKARKMLSRSRGTRQELHHVEAGKDFRIPQALTVRFKILYTNPVYSDRRSSYHMTCQWCTYYRRRGGTSLCLARGSDLAAALCDRFDPRKSCTTCNFRCGPDERERLVGNGDGCPKWELRKLSTWGGARRFQKTRKTKKVESKEEVK